MKMPDKKAATKKAAPKAAIKKAAPKAAIKSVGINTSKVIRPTGGKVVISGLTGKAAGKAKGK